MDKLIKAVVTVVAVIIAAVFLATMVLYQSYVAWCLWNWHVAPLVGVPLPFGHTVGILALLSWTLREPHAEKGETYQTRMYIRELAFPAILLLIGWLVRWL